MPTLLRNPFRKQDENVRPTSAINGIEQKVNGTPTSKPVEIAAGDKEPTEYKLSEINDSGVYLPPSPTERKSFWSTASSRSTTSTNHRSLLPSDDQFSISRESFDSYRRSFDISARSPIIQAHDSGKFPRASLDSKTFQAPPRSSFDSRTFQPPPPRSSNSFTRPSQVPAETREEPQQDFEDVDIHDKPATATQPNKRGLFSRITGYNDHSERPASQDGKSWHHFGGRRRGQSGQGAELGAIPKRETTPKPESQLKKEHHHSHSKHQSVDAQSAKTASKDAVREEAPKAIKVTEPAQATSGAEQTADGSPVDSGVEVERAGEAMQNVSLDAPAKEVKKEVTAAKAQDDVGLKPLKPQNPQAPEVKVDS